MLRVYSGFLLSVFTIVLAAACNESDNPAQQYGNTMVQSLKTAKSVEKKVNVEEVKKSIQEFNAANGRYPADLSELATFNGVTLKSDNYEYDPSTGNLSEKQ